MKIEKLGFYRALDWYSAPLNFGDLITEIKIEAIYINHNLLDDDERKIIFLNELLRPFSVNAYGKLWVKEFAIVKPWSDEDYLNIPYSREIHDRGYANDN